MRKQHGPDGAISQLKRTKSPSVHTGRLAAVALSLALLAICGGASTALAQTGGAAAGGEPPPSSPPPSGSGWTVTQNATWYGPGLWGNSTACGLVLRPAIIGVANKNLPCGTSVTFSYAGRTVPATVIDRGPYRKGYAWDLTKKLAKRLGFLPVGAGPVTATVVLPAP
jgi:rare lipoprotein A (peptidoglycan hydrolase)